MHWKHDDCQVKGSRWLLVGILFLAGALRLTHAGAASLWFDEAFSVIAARADIGSILRGGADPVLPPFYFVLLHCWQLIAGESELAVRALSAFCSLLAVAIVYRLGLQLFDRRAGLWSAGLMAVAPFHIYYAQEARPYALSVVLSAGLLWVLVWAIAGSRLSAWLGYVCLATLGLYTHYFFALFLATLHLWVLIYHRRWTLWRVLLFGDFLVAVLFLPHVGLALSRFRTVTGAFWVERPSVLGMFKTLDFLLFAGTTPTWLVGVTLFGTIGLLAVVCLDLVRLRYRSAAHAATALCLLVMGLPLAAAFVVSQFGSSVYLDRSFALVTPAYVLLLGLGLSVRPRRSPALVLTLLLGGVAVVSLGNFYLWPDPAKPDFRQAGQFMCDRVQPDDRLLHLHDSTYFSLRYYASDVESAIVENDRPWLLPEAWPRFATHVPTEWVETLPVETRLWVAVEPKMCGHRQQEVLEGLKSWQQLERLEAHGVRLYLFRKDAR
jgi:mannosyltransferase